MIQVTALIDNYIERIEASATLKEAQRITDDMMLYSYRLPENTKADVELQIRPFITAVGLELAKTDPLVQRAHQLLGL